MTEAEARIGKRYIIFKSRWAKVPSWTTGTVIRAKQEYKGGQPWVGKGEMPRRRATDVVWTLDIQCADLHKTVFSVDERDESIAEFGGPSPGAPAERLGCEGEEEAA
jgi:hypothetical protein